MASDPKYLVWTDLETSGTDETKDKILEIGMSVRQIGQNSIELGAFSVPVYPDDGLSFEFMESVDPFVNQMHHKNFLWDDIYNNGVSLQQAERDAIIRLTIVGKPHEFVLAGSGVSHFDRRFLAAQMPELLKWFTYYNIDVGVLRRTLQYMKQDDLLKPFDQDKPHRALADARIHADEYSYIERQLELRRPR